MRGQRIFQFFILFLLALAPADRLAAQQQQRVPVERATVQQKASYLETLVTRSLAAKTIENSDDADAKAELAHARALVQEAKDDLGAGRIDQANDKLDQALTLVNTEARRLSGDQLKEDSLQRGYEKRLAAMKVFLTAYKRVAQEKELTAAAAAETANLEGLIAEAESLAQNGHVGEANAVLDRAYQLTRRDIRELREGETLTRSLVFDTPADEYKYELDRNDSHVLLLKLALSEKTPPASFVKRIEQLRTDALGLRGQAEKQAGGGDYPSAIQLLVRSTDTLLKAIRMGGIYIPG